MYDIPAQSLTETELRALEAKYCSWGDTVHYLPDISTSRMTDQFH